MERARKLTKQIGFLVLNCWLVFHVFAVFIAPAGMPPASPLLVDASQVATPYNQALFLNHGYHYFAPDPGASTLIAYSVKNPDEPAINGRFPNTSIFPRLLYHRYFMLAENIGAFPEQTQDEVYDAYARHFALKHDGAQIDLAILRHEPSSISRIQAGGELSDEETFFDEPMGTWNIRPLGGKDEQLTDGDLNTQPAPIGAPVLQP